jgi:hypothetical protein
MSDAKSGRRSRRVTHAHAGYCDPVGKNRLPSRKRHAFCMNPDGPAHANGVNELLVIRRARQYRVRAARRPRGRDEQM